MSLRHEQENDIGIYGQQSGSAYEKVYEKIIKHPLFVHLLRAVNDVDGENLPYLQAEDDVDLTDEDPEVTAHLTRTLTVMELHAKSWLSLLQKAKTGTQPIEPMRSLQPSSPENGPSARRNDNIPTTSSSSSSSNVHYTKPPPLAQQQHRILSPELSSQRRASLRSTRSSTSLSPNVNANNLLSINPPQQNFGKFTHGSNNNPSPISMPLAQPPPTTASLPPEPMYMSSPSTYPNHSVQNTNPSLKRSFSESSADHGAVSSQHPQGGEKFMKRQKGMDVAVGRVVYPRPSSSSSNNLSVDSFDALFAMPTIRAGEKN